MHTCYIHMECVHILHMHVVYMCTCCIHVQFYVHMLHSLNVHILHACAVYVRTNYIHVLFVFTLHAHVYTRAVCVHALHAPAVHMHTCYIRLLCAQRYQIASPVLVPFLSRPQVCDGVEPRRQQRSDLNGPVDNNNVPEVRPSAGRSPLQGPRPIQSLRGAGGRPRRAGSPCRRRRGGGPALRLTPCAPSLTALRPPALACSTSGPFDSGTADTGQTVLCRAVLCPVGCWEASPSLPARGSSHLPRHRPLAPGGEVTL